MIEKTKKKSSVLLLLIFLIVWIILPTGVVFAEPVYKEAPQNPQFQDYIDSGGSEYGLIPSPVDLSHMIGQTVQQRFRTVSSAVYYDLRDSGRVTPVQDQGSASTCWTFASLASLESCLLPGETWDFSENNMKNALASSQPDGFDRSHDGEGNAYMSIAYLSRWSGPVEEDDDPYNVSSGVSPTGLTVQKHVQEVLLLPNRSGFTDNEIIKNALVNYGAVYVTYDCSGGSYNAINYAYYSQNTVPDHAVAIIGWDDNFGKDKFGTEPPGNGAFLVKNSWGDIFGDNGYFWISYYDCSLSNLAVFIEAEAADNYENNYQYDPLGWVTSIGCSSDTAWFANVFTVGSDEAVKAVSFYTPALNSEYEIKIYSGVDKEADNPPISGTLETTESGTIPYAGYHTVELSTPVYVENSSDFSVVVTLTTPGYIYPICIEDKYTGYSSNATAAAGQSYVSVDGESWDDLTSIYTNANVCLKAFTDPVLPSPVLTADSADNTVDNDIEITFIDDNPWRSSIMAVKINGTAINPSTDYLISAGVLTLKPGGGNTLLQTSGNKTVSIEADGYATATVMQSINHGELFGLEITQQPVPGKYSSYTFATQPEVILGDQYGNTVTSAVYGMTTVIAAPKSGDTWFIGGTTSVGIEDGVAVFTNLTHTNKQDNAKITFTCADYTIDSAAMNLPDIRKSGGGGGAVPAPTPPVSIIHDYIMTADDESLEKSLLDNNEAVLSLQDIGKNTAEISTAVIAGLAKGNTPLKVNNTGISLNFVPGALNVTQITGAEGETVIIGAQEVSSQEKEKILTGLQAGGNSSLIEIGGKIFNLEVQVKKPNGDSEKIEKFAVPVTVTINLSYLGELSEEQIKQLVGVRLIKDDAGNIVPVSLGGSYNSTTKTFSFNTETFSEYTVMQRKGFSIDLYINRTTVKINGENVTIDSPPVLMQNRTMVPVRFVAEKMGIKVDWIESTQTVKFTGNGKNISLVIGQTGPGLDVPPVIVNQRTMVPLRFISEFFDATVIWHPETQSVEIIG